jgi:signal transduction histidine kinase
LDSTPAPDLGLDRLLLFARRLQRAATFRELLEIAREEAMQATGYQHVWFMVADREQADELRLIDFSGDNREFILDVAPVLKVKGDSFLEEVMSSNVPVVIEDARTDPRTNKKIVEQLSNRTLIKIPLCLIDKPFGIFGIGTFGDEGCRAPTPWELHYLVGMAGQIAVAASRIRYLESRAQAHEERVELERRLAQVQKLESLGLLAGGIAHDFNNLLTVILSSAALAERQAGEQPELLAELRSILGAAQRASDLTRQLLAMSRSQELELRPLDMNVQLSQLLSLARRILPASIEIDFIEGRGMPMVEGDASRKMNQKKITRKRKGRRIPC